MASGAGAIRAGRAFIELLAKPNLEPGLRAAGARLKAWGNSLKAVGSKMAFLGAGITAPIVLATKQIAALDDMKKRLDFKDATGVAVSDEQVESAKAFDVALSGVGAKLALIATELASAVTPVIKEFSAWVTSIAGPVSKWISENKSLVQTIFKIGAAAAAVGAGLVLAGTALSLLGAAFTAVGAIASVVFSPFLLAIGAVAAVVGGLGYLFVTQTDTGKAAWSSFAGDAKTAWGGIVDAVKAGDLGRVFTIIGAFLKLEWTRVTSFLVGKWHELTNSIAEAMVSVGTGVLNGWASFTGELAKLWEQFIAFISGSDATEAINAIDDATRAQIEANNSGEAGAQGALLTAHEAKMEALRKEVEEAERKLRLASGGGLSAKMQSTSKLEPPAVEAALAKAGEFTRGVFGGGAVGQALGGGSNVADKILGAEKENGRTLKGIERNTRNMKPRFT